MGKVNVKWEWSIPNILSILRILILPLFVWFYLTSSPDNNRLYYSVGILILSGLTDLLDGIIARKFNQITDIGKILDPVADKITQIVVIICLSINHRMMIPLLIMSLIKEISQGLGGLVLLRKGVEVKGAKWYGKVSTFVFYGAMAIIVLWTNIPKWFENTLIGIVAALMLYAFLKYAIDFFTIRKETSEKEALEEKQNSQMIKK